MAQRVEEYDLGVGMPLRWEPNAPDAALVADDFGRAALGQRAHPDDADQRCVVLRWDMAVFAQLSPYNDEGRGRHRLYSDGLRDIVWLGVVRDSDLVEELRPVWMARDGFVPMHYVVASKECVVEVVAENIDYFRFPGSPREAAAASFQG